MAKYDGTFTELDHDEWSLFEYGCELLDVSLSDQAIWMLWSEDGQRQECELRPKVVRGVDCWVGTLHCDGWDDGDGELTAIRYDTADDGAILVAKWILGEVSGRCIIEITRQADGRE